MVVHVPHAVTLETELGRQIEEDVLDLFFGARNLGLSSPSRVRLSRALTSGKSV